MRIIKGEARHDVTEDRGCSLAPLCRECHLPYCRYDESVLARDYWKAVKEATRAQVAQTILRFSAEGLMPREIGATVGLSERTVDRVIERARGEPRRPGRPPGTRG